MSEEEVDPEQLQRELRQIKSAMGIHERYPGQFKLWLVYGVAVPVAAALSQYVVLADLPEYLHAVVWFGAIGGAWGLSSILLNVGNGWETAGKPSIPLVYVSVFSLYAVVLATFSQVGGEPNDPQTGVFAIIVGLVGVSYLLVGNVLKAYYIRDRDRYAFYVGGVWMVALATAIPLVEPLRTWGYAAFGGLYAAHSIGSYLYLSRSE